MYIRYNYRKKHSPISKLKVIFLFIIMILLFIIIDTFAQSLNIKLLRTKLISTINTEINIIDKSLTKDNTNNTSLARLDALNKTKATLLNISNDENTKSMLKDLSAAPKEIQNLIAVGYKYIGSPYEFGANGPDAFDCSSFIQYIFKQFNIILPRVTYDQVSVGKKVKFNRLKPGDIVFTEGTIKKPEHVGIYIGDGQMIHASKSNSIIVVGPVYNFVTARRIF